MAQKTKSMGYKIAHKIIKSVPSSKNPHEMLIFLFFINLTIVLPENYQASASM